MASARATPAALGDRGAAAVRVWHDAFQPPLVGTEARLNPSLAQSIIDILERGILTSPGCVSTVKRALIFDATTPVFSCIGGSAHNILGLLENERPFDVVLPYDDDLPRVPGAEIVPFAALQNTLTSYMARSLNLLDLVTRLVDKPVVHLDAPPPVGDEAFILKNLEPAFMERSPNARIAHPVLRLKLYRMHSHIMRTRCADLGIDFIASPPDVTNEGGFLRAEFFGENATHANAAYGSLVLEQIKHVMVGGDARESTT